MGLRSAIRNASPCPFCGSTEVSLHGEYTWKGMQPSQLICVELRHFCKKYEDDDYVNRSFRLRGRTEEQALEAWNKRTS